ncbi:cytidylyltransferase domain-containing protein [Chloroflexota bacterium]
MIVAIVQARTGSSRLPGKVLHEILGKPVLWHIIDRLKGSGLIGRIAIATTDKESDKPILKLAQDSGVDSYAGSEEDVLDRYYQAATKFGADIIIRITADCALVDCRIVEQVIQRYLRGDCDYAANTLKLTYPDGLDVEIFSCMALEKAWKEARCASQREHVTPYIRDNPGKFRLANVENSVNLSHFRWVVDREEDLEFVRQVYKHLYKEGQSFYMEDILKLLRKYPDLEQINQGIATNEGYAKSLKGDRIVK